MNLGWDPVKWRGPTVRYENVKREKQKERGTIEK